jgi:hypothetical protein
MTRLLIYAGPNGSGKSSLREAQSEPVDIVIDADQIARTLNPTHPRNADRAAGRQALLLFQSAIAARQTISLETTLAGHSILTRLAAAKAAGYTLELAPSRSIWSTSTSNACKPAPRSAATPSPPPTSAAATPAASPTFPKPSPSCTAPSSPTTPAPPHARPWNGPPAASSKPHQTCRIGCAPSCPVSRIKA